MRAFAIAACAVLPLIAEEAAFRQTALEKWKDELARRGTTGLLLVHRGKIVYEWYAEGWNAERPHGTASMAKALVGGLSLAIALEDGRLSAEDLASRFIPAWKSDPRKSRITIRHLATHTSGIEDAEADGLPHEQLPGWKGAFWARKPDPFSIAVQEAPAMEEPGTRYRYSNPGMAALAWCVTASLRGAPRQDIRALLAARIMEPLGIAPEHWPIGYNRPYEIEGMRLYANWGGGSYTPRAVARVAEMLANGGVYRGRRLLSQRTVARALAYAGMPKPDRTKAEYDPASGLGFYVNQDRVWPALPGDAFAGSGAGNQCFLAVPSLGIVVVRHGAEILDRKIAGNHFRGEYEYVFEPAIHARETGAPYPPSPLIREIRFAPVDTIRRDAIDSDNWPITWGADGELYTSYGDGRGFAPPVERKLSLGYARIEGGPEDYRGINIRSETGERTGDGRSGVKSSGLAMVDGVLYQWVRNAGNSQLMWSEDGAKAWTWGFKLDTSFGSPAFLNFGKNNAGARDSFVYMYSQDGPSAYDSHDGVVLARSPEARLRERTAMEFFAGLDGTGKPRWSKRIEERKPVFLFPGHCQRVDAVYNAGLRRYLMAVGYHHAGGWGIFDAPEPWGPWTTAFHAAEWDVPETHGYRIPSKWIAKDGKSFTLVFSGRNRKGMHYDAFATRRAEIRTK